MVVFGLGEVSRFTAGQNGFTAGLLGGQKINRQDGDHSRGKQLHE